MLLVVLDIMLIGRADGREENVGLRGGRYDSRAEFGPVCALFMVPMPRYGREGVEDASAVGKPPAGVASVGRGWPKRGGRLPMEPHEGRSCCSNGNSLGERLSGRDEPTGDFG